MKVSVIIPVYNVENYIKETLVSIQKQTLTEYEVIIVNDDSPDNSQVIIDEFCLKDKRFKSFMKLNEGVSAARNYGLEKAQGEYVLFVDGDDILPEKALENMYREAREQQADMVIGKIREFGIYGKPVYARTKELAELKNIDRYDPRILWTFSVCNKLLKKEVIDRYHLRFEKIKHAEDGLFLFNFLYKCGKITGCNSIVYEYRKRPFWEEKSATQAATESHLKDLLYALEGIIALASEQRRIETGRAEAMDNSEFLYAEQTKYKFAEYLSSLYYRIIDISLLGGYYRQIWKNDDGVLEIVRQSIEKYKHRLFPEMWEKIVSENKDLRLEEGILGKDDLCARPLITVAVSDRAGDAHIQRIADSVISQQSPAVVLRLHSRYRTVLDSSYLGKANISFVDGEPDTAAFKNAVLKEAVSPYICFIDHPVYININTFKIMYNWLEENEMIDFASCKIKLLKGDKIADCPPHDITFFKKYSAASTKTVYHETDWMMDNKLFKTSALKTAKIVFTEDIAADTAKCFKKLKFKTLGNVYVFTALSRKDILAGVKSLRVKLLWRLRYRRGFSMTKAEKERKKKARTELKYSILWKIKQAVIRLMPIQKKVLFVSVRGNKLLENAKAVYDAYDGKKAVFAKMYPHSAKDKLKLYRHLFTSKVIVTDDYLKYFRMFELKPQQRVIQIWHACGAFKKFGLDYPSAEINKERKTHAQYDVVAVSSEAVRDKYAKAFGISIDKVKALGVPRTDPLSDPAYIASEKKAFYKKYPKLSGKKILLYAPTFREEGTKRVRLQTGLDWQAVSEKLGDEAVLIIKNHPVMKYDLLDGALYGNIINMPKENTSRLMIVCDVMVTDYSSVIFEAALLNKPTIFYCPDFDHYERDFYLNFPEDLYGEFAVNQEEFFKAVDKSLQAPDMDRLEIFKKTYMGSCDGHSAERIAEIIRENLNQG